ncbi:NirD/YgiW/YdeI family stress tolerance protein [Reichenbachiella carrageenanivorans]|uniref:NirD/YgiW/YdeI family stress tolerance protein n=1 Tax=Reichenbachiella carrageenanivorans TaxID=2979869 RepID=A0ABY6CXN1_9BACT|nr:NirD/YgiW/YdeI family stress tolerance protein [Reichenbachiella carrageenanivorans]UXX78135.1 NirD/YgiW/YdeI family stress tolerance protein [Reichenbachiella carrageenanivorans]
MRKSLVFAILLIAPLLSFAQYTGPNAKKIHFTVEEILSNGAKYDKEGTAVTLHGYIIEAEEERDTYVFKDRTGKIKVEIPLDGLPHTPFDDKDLVVIIGHVKSKKETIVQVKKTMVLHVNLEELRKEHQQIKSIVDTGDSTAVATPMSKEEMMSEDAEEEVTKETDE